MYLPLASLSFWSTREHADSSHLCYKHRVELPRAVEEGSAADVVTDVAVQLQSAFSEIETVYVNLYRVQARPKKTCTLAAAAAAANCVCVRTLPISAGARCFAERC